VSLVLAVVGVCVHQYLDSWRYYLFPRRFGVVEEGRIFRSGLIWRGLVEDVLRDHRIATVVDMSGHGVGDGNVAAERAAAARLGARVVEVNGLAGDGSGDFGGYVTAVTEMVRAEPGKAVLVHCAGGSERTGVSVALYRMLFQGWDGARAWDEYLSYRRSPPDDDRLARLVNERMPDVARRLVDAGVLPRVPERMPVFGPAPSE
jgi:hypothetical protein